MHQDLPKTERTRLRRYHERGHFDRETIYAILDAMPLCHVGYVIDGAPAVAPTMQWRAGDRVYWHGSSASRGLRAAEGMDVCLTVSLLDGFVLARSGMHHSANYRSAMIYGRATKVANAAEKEASLKVFVERLYPGRWDMLWPMTGQEAKATTVLVMPIEEDYALPIWSGVVPVSMTVGAPEADPRNLPDVAVPDHVRTITIG